VRGLIADAHYTACAGTAGPADCSALERCRRGLFSRQWRGWWGPAGMDLMTGVSAGAVGKVERCGAAAAVMAGSAQRFPAQEPAAPEAAAGCCSAAADEVSAGS
jgi:hypothetical protein